MDKLEIELGWNEEHSFVKVKSVKPDTVLPSVVGELDEQLVDLIEHRIFLHGEVVYFLAACAQVLSWYNLGDLSWEVRMKDPSGKVHKMEHSTSDG